MTKVSIIIPFHNVEQYITQCIESLINQTLSDIEIIFINDCSTDSSAEIVQKYMQNDKRIILLNTEKESGQSHARNLGLDVASGEYIGFVDSDDWVEVDMFEKMYHKALSGGTDITMCMAQLYDDKENKTYTDDYYSLKPLSNMGDSVFSANDTKDEILNINVVLWNKIYRKNFLKSIGIKLADGYIYEDLLFFYQTYLKAKRVNILWEALYYYRQNRKYSTMQNSDKKVYDRIPMVEATYKTLQEADFFKEKKAEIVSWIIDDIFHRYTLLEDKYYEDYYPKMQNFFKNIEQTLTEEDKAVLAKSYCVDEFNNVIERSYLGFWSFLIEKYKTSNKRIKAAEHKCNLDIIAIKEYLERYKKEAAEEKENAIKWWENHCNEEKKWWENHFSEEITKLKNIHNEEMQKQIKEIQKQAKDMQTKMEKQEYELKSWQAESVRQTTEKLTADYEWKLEELKKHYEDSLQKQKYYYENNFLLVKIILKIYKQIDIIKNKIKNLIKKN